MPYVRGWWMEWVNNVGVGTIDANWGNWAQTPRGLLEGTICVPAAACSFAQRT
jgi:hypothetical protein